MSQLLHRADRPWADLTDEILRHVHTGRPVLWVGFSQALLTFEKVDGLLTRTRQAPAGVQHLGDGLPLLVEPPLVATACGCSDGTGYRSTRPLLVAAVTGDDDVRELLKLSRTVARQLVDAGYDPAAVPAGHPQKPCGAISCPRAAFTS